MWTFLATDAMGFGALFITYGFLRVRADAWPDPRARLSVAAAALMTFALLASSLTITLAARAERRAPRLVWLAATLALAIAFVGGGALEYAHLLTGPRTMGLSTDLFSGTFYAITGYHGLHVLGGVLALCFMFGARIGPRALGVLALYWHFVDLAWMPIFTFLYLLPPA
jgi:heme/copper-type cytochrome/quinol oxidase subunit 3